MTSWTEAVLPWVSAGLKVSRSQVLDKLDLSEPEDEDDTIELTPKATGTQPVDPNAPAGGAPGAQRPGAKKTPGKAAHATTDALTGWDALMQPHVDQLEELAREHNSYEAFLEHLKLAPSNPLIERLVQEALAARLAAEGEE
jgi:phage gp29-like protein